MNRQFLLMFALITKENLLLMKKFQLVSWISLCFLALQFSSCDNEPLEGEFPQPQQINAEEGQFVASIEGVEFLAESAGAAFDQFGNFVVSGQKSSTGEIITIAVANGAVGTFDITGTGDANAGVYIDADMPLYPFTTDDDFGGSGILEILEIDMEAMTVSGTFAMEVGREAVDSEGNPITDGNGNPVIQNISITNGAFNAIPYIEETTGGGGGGGGGVNINDSFFAKVDDVDFVPETLTTTRNIISDVPMINIFAYNLEGEKIRIDIPESLGTGTFAMEQLSDGTKLIAQYNAGTGTEDLSSNPGTIEITEFNTLTGRIVANFSFTATDPLGLDPTVVEVTEGAMEVHYEPGATNPSNTMIASIGGASWSADFADAFEFDLSGTQTVTARGYNSTTGESIEITFPKDLEPGSYDFVSMTVAGESVARYYPAPGGTEFTSTDGAIIVITNELEMDGSINAAFLFFGEDLSGGDPTTYNITSGEFTVELP